MEKRSNMHENPLSLEKNPIPFKLNKIYKS